MQVKAKSPTALLSFECSEGKNNTLATINFPKIRKHNIAEVWVFYFLFLLCLENISLTDSVSKNKTTSNTREKPASYVWSRGDGYEQQLSEEEEQLKHVVALQSVLPSAADLHLELNINTYQRNTKTCLVSRRAAEDNTNVIFLTVPFKLICTSFSSICCR